MARDRSKNFMLEIKTSKGNVADLQATIGKEVANVAIQAFAIEDLAGQIVTDEADLKAAIEIHTKVASIFGAEEKNIR